MEKQKLDYAQTTVCLYSIKDQPNMLLFLSIMLCCSALKIHLLYSILCSRTVIVVRLLWYLYTILHEQFTKCNRKFVKTVLLECINERYQVHHVQSYDDCSIRVYRSFTTIFHKCLVLLLILIFILHFPNAGIMLNAFNDPLRLKACWNNRRVPMFSLDLQPH